tara:strand:- start:3098 stop:3316 length:219 start_codon:yes stop_codon:yes gene_type:complete
MLNKLRSFSFITSKTRWLGWFVSVHLLTTATILLMLIAMGINPTLLVSVIGAPLWIGVAFSSKYITDKIMED